MEFDIDIGVAGVGGKVRVGLSMLSPLKTIRPKSRPLPCLPFVDRRETLYTQST